MTKLSEKAKVEQLETLVLSATKEELKDFIVKNKPFELVSRALGLACRCAQPEIVSLLVEQKIKFAYSKSGAHIAKYGLRYKRTSGTQYACFELLPIVNNIWQKNLFGEMQKRFPVAEQNIVYGEFFKGEIDLTPNPAETTAAAADVRAKNLQIVYQNKLLKQSSLDDMFYYSIIENETEIASLLENWGAKLSCDWMFADKHTNKDISEYNRFMQALHFKNDEELCTVLTHLAKALNAVGEKLYVYERITNYFKKRSAAVYEAFLLCTGGNETKYAVNKQSQKTENAVWKYHQFADGTICLTRYQGEDVAVSIPECIENHAVTAIGDNCFSAKNYEIQTIILPDGIKTIGKQAFCGCTCLAEITIPKSVEKIGLAAFNGCENLAVIHTSSNEVLAQVWKILGTKQKNQILANLISQGCDLAFVVEKVKANKRKWIEHAITANNIPLLHGVFSYFKTMSIAELETYLQMAEDFVESTAFLLTYKTQHYSLPQQEDYETEKADKAIGITERKPADWKRIFIYQKTTKGLVITGYKDSETIVSVPQKIGGNPVVEIAKGAFSPTLNKVAKDVKANREKISSVHIAEGLRKIGEAGFAHCTSLSDIVLPDSITNIGSFAFNGCEQLKTISIPNKIKKIGQYTFNGCKSLTTIDIPSGVKEIGNYAFCDCSRLDTITIPDSVSCIGDVAFARCVTLSTLSLPPTLQYISAGMCYHCENLECIDIPPSVTSIKVNAFRGCKKLAKVTLHNNVVAIDALAFLECPNLTIHAPAGSYAEQYAKENNIPFVAE